MNLKQTLLSALAVVIVLSITSAVWAGKCCCPGCGNKVCCAISEEKTIDKHCYEVECEDICIPKFRMPWEKCCKPKCARVKTVRVLKKVNYECKSCGYKWEVNCVDGCCSGGCNKGSKGSDQDIDIKSIPTPTPVKVSNTSSQTEGVIQHVSRDQPQAKVSTKVSSKPSKQSTNIKNTFMSYFK